jgi:hypothetical protein
MDAKHTIGFVASNAPRQGRAPGKRPIGFVYLDPPSKLERGFAQVLRSNGDKASRANWVLAKIFKTVRQALAITSIFAAAAIGVAVREAFVKTNSEGLQGIEITEARAKTVYTSVKDITGSEEIAFIAGKVTTEVSAADAVFEKNAETVRRGILQKKQRDTLER